MGGMGKIADYGRDGENSGLWEGWGKWRTMGGMGKIADYGRDGENSGLW